MWFLLLQILFLLLLAALAGALLTYWWMRNHFEDVTESYEDMTRAVGNFGSQPTNYLTRDDLEVGLSSINVPDVDLLPVQERLMGLETAFSGLSVPEPDLGPVNERLEMIEAHLLSPNQDLDALHARLTNLEGSLSNVSAAVSGLGDLRNTNLQPMEQQVQALYTAVSGIRAPDLQPFESRLVRLEETIGAFRVPDVDLTRVHSGLSRLEQMVNEVKTPAPNLEPVHTHISQLESKVAELGERLEGAGESDVDRITSDLEALSMLMADLRTPDLQPLADRISGIEAALSALSIPETDLAPLYQRLEVLRAQIVAPNKDLDALHTRFASLESTLSMVDRAPTDITPLVSRMSGLEASVSAILSELHNDGRSSSLEPIERRLAGLQEAFLSMPQPDMSGVIRSIQSSGSSVDLSATEDRLTAIEFGLAAVHKMLRSRTETNGSDSRSSVASIAGATLESRIETRSVPLAPVRPPRATDPINSARRPDDRANLLMRAAFGTADDLEQISGIGPMLRQLLNDIGVFYFWQIAEWNPQDVDWVDDKLEHFKGRIERDDWVDQAQSLALMPSNADRPSS